MEKKVSGHVASQKLQVGPHHPPKQELELWWPMGTKHQWSMGSSI